MRLTLNRIYKNSRYTIGKLYIDGVYFCDTLEDTDRELDNKMPIDKIKSIKVNAQTAIPKGEYKITLNVLLFSLNNLKPICSSGSNIFSR